MIFKLTSRSSPTIAADTLKPGISHIKRVRWERLEMLGVDHGLGVVDHGVDRMVYIPTSTDHRLSEAKKCPSAFLVDSTLVGH